MPPLSDPGRVLRCCERAKASLLAERGPHGHWEGELSASALSTATAVMALELVSRRSPPCKGGETRALRSGL